MNYFKKLHSFFNLYSIVFTSFIVSSIIFILDYLDITNLLFAEQNMIYTEIVLVLILIYFICEIFKRKLWNLLFLSTMTYFDKIITVLLFSEVLSIYSYIVYYSYWKNILFLILVVNILIVIIRVIHIEKISKKSNDKHSNIYNIYDLYNNKIKNTNQSFILLEEEAIKSENEDLLDLSLFTDSIRDSLLHCNPKKTFVTSLIGKWGCGKTSIINLLKLKINSSNICLIDTFSPWKYDNKISLFRGFYNYIFKLIGKNYGYVNYKSMIKKYEKVIFNMIERTTNISLPTIFAEDDEQELETIKKQINDIIKYNDKKIIIVIDDIDRLGKEEILFTFKMVKNIFDFDNIVYILSYDETRIKKIFEQELKIDSDYLNKIVQDKVYVPIIEKEKIIDIGTKCLSNLLNIYNIGITDKNHFSKISNLIFNNFEDLREVIRFINSISTSIKFLYILKLDISDYLVLEFIKFKDITLYNNIYNNSKYFISEDSNYGMEYEYIWPEKYNEEAKHFFDDLFKDEKIKELLCYVFPNVKKYDDNHPIKEKYYYVVNDDRINSIKNRRCYNGRFFKNYFTIRHSFFTELNILVNDFITNVNNGKKIEKEFNYIIRKVNPNNYDLLFELLNIRIKEISDSSSIFDYVLDNIDKYEDGIRFLGLNSCDRAKILLSSIIDNEQEQGKQKEYIDLIYEKDYFLLEEVLRWLKPDKYEQNSHKEFIYNYGKGKLEEKLELDINNKVNIFNAENSRGYFWLLYRNIEDKEKLKKYVMSYVNNKTIFKFLGMFITTYYGMDERYDFSNENLKLYTTREKVDSILKKVNYDLNSEQEKVLFLYNNSGNNRDYKEKVYYEKL